MKRVWIHKFLDKKVVFVISQEIVFQDFLVRVYIPQGYLGIVINKTDVVVVVAVINKTCIIGQVKEPVSSTVGGTKKMTERIVIKTIADSKKYFFLENFVYVTVKFPNCFTGWYELQSKQSYAVHSRRGQVGVYGQQMIALLS